MSVANITSEIKQKKPFASKAQETAVTLLRTADVMRRLLDVVLADRDITGQQYNVLRILRGAGERGLPTLDIAERMIEETPGITRLIDRLEAKKLVSRERCTVDRRRVYCRITAAGLSLLDAADAPLREALEASVGSLRKQDLATLVDLLDRVRERSQQQVIERRGTHS